MATILTGASLFNLDPKVETMNAISKFANDLLNEHGLYEQGWRFEFSNKKVALGTCYYDEKKIVYSLNYLHVPEEEWRDTILHEVAHALVDPREQSHGAVWRTTAARIGARPERCAPEGIKSSAQHNYMMKCPKCDRKWYRYRMRQRNFRSVCPDCRVQIKIYKIERG